MFFGPIYTFLGPNYLCSILVYAFSEISLRFLSVRKDHSILAFLRFCSICTNQYTIRSQQTTNYEKLFGLKTV